MTKRLIGGLMAAALLAAGPVAAQTYGTRDYGRNTAVQDVPASPAPDGGLSAKAAVVVCASGCAAPISFSPEGAATLSATTTSARVALPSGANVLLVNNGSADLYYKFGSSTVAATTADFPLPAGRAIVVSAGSNGYVAAITGSGSTTLAVTTGSGSPVISGGGGGGGSGGGDASAANQTDLLSRIGEVQASPTANTVLDRLKTIDASVQDVATAVGAISSAATVADGADVTQGAKADSACASSASSCSLVAILKGLLDAAQDTTAVTVQGGVASGSADSGNPLKTGGLAKTSDPAAVADGQRVADLHDPLGKQVAIPALRAQKGVQQTTITSSTSETTIVTAGAAGVFRDLYGLVIANTSASDGSCTIKDATAGTTRAVIAVGAGKTGGFALDAGSAIPQAAAANNWTATCTSLASWNITAMFVATKG